MPKINKKIRFDVFPLQRTGILLVNIKSGQKAFSTALEEILTLREKRSLL
jgi:hypothetical protein